jgi:hypothetical protein
VGSDQQNGDGPDSQYDIEDSEPKETVNFPARADCWNVLFGRNNGGHVKHSVICHGNTVAIANSASVIPGPPDAT